MKKNTVLIKYFSKSIFQKVCFQGISHIHTHFYITIKNVDANTPEICMNHLGDNLFIQKNNFTTKCEQSTPLQDF